MFFATVSGRLLRFDPIFAQLLQLHMRPAGKRPLALGHLLGKSTVQTFEQLIDDRFVRTDCKLPDGRILLVRARRSAGGVRGWIEDVSALRRSASRLQFAARHDPLTGLVNRRGLYRPLSEFIGECDRAPASLIFIDLDGFKQINDVFGHAAGDSVLRQFATRLRQTLPHQHLAARTGGDEFVIALRGQALQQADDWLDYFRRAVSQQPFKHFEHEFALRFSAGRIQIQPTMTPDAALEAADRDCARAKAREPASSAAVYATLPPIDGATFESDLEIQAQSVRALHDRLRPIGSEWLLRQRDRSGRLRRPAEFLLAARSQGLAARVDLWMIGRALAWLSSQAAGTHRGPRQFCVVKLTTESLHDQRFQRQALELLQRHSRVAAGLRFELSGRHALQDSGSITEFVDAARALGARAVLSGLSQFPVWMPHLSRLRPAAIKVDASWFCNRGDNAVTRSCVRALIDTCRALDIAACACRIESQADLDTAQQQGFDQAQGFLFGPLEPVSLESIEQLAASFWNPA